MSLLTEAMEPCCYIDKTTQNDGYGGVETVWVDGAVFDAAFVLRFCFGFIPSGKGGREAGRDRVLYHHNRKNH